MLLALGNELHEQVQISASEATRAVGAQPEITREAELERQLWQSQKTEAIGQLAGGVAHDFNNLLVVMMGYLDLASSGMPQTAENYRNLKQVQKACERAAALTRQLLAFSRKQNLQPKVLDVNDLIDNLLKMIRRVIGEDIELHFVPANGSDLVRVDPGQVEQVIMNLCVNARDAMPDGGTLTVTTENVCLEEGYCQSRPWAKPGRYSAVRVEDSGCGMSEEVLQRVFEPFFTTKEEGKGTGLGLSTVYGIVKQHGALLNVRSGLGVGTVFEVYFPTVTQREDPPEESANDDVCGGTETILLAEDDEVVRGLAVRLLEKAGYTVLVATNGLEAVQAYKDHHDEIDLALIDVVMPGLKAGEIHSELNGADPSARVLFMSGHVPDGPHVRCVLEEGGRLLQKPFDSDSLLRTVREVLDRND